MEASRICSCLLLEGVRVPTIQQEVYRVCDCNDVQRHSFYTLPLACAIQKHDSLPNCRQENHFQVFQPQHVSRTLVTLLNCFLQRKLRVVESCDWLHGYCLLTIVYNNYV